MGEEFDSYTCNDLPRNVHDQGCPSQAILEGDLDLQMDKAGPSGVNNDTPELSSPPFVLPLSGDADEYSLSNLRCSCHIACCVEQVGLQQWGHNTHVWQFIVEESDEEDEVTEEKQVMQEDVVMEDEGFNSDEDFQEDEDEYEMPGAELGQEGVSVWDLLGESFLKKASQLGVSTSICTFTDV
jgi:hypothetical protein